MARNRNNRNALKQAHQLLQLTVALADMLTVPAMSKVLTAVADSREAKLRAQRKTRKAQAARARRHS